MIIIYNKLSMTRGHYYVFEFQSCFNLDRKTEGSHKPVNPTVLSVLTGGPTTPPSLTRLRAPSTDYLSARSPVDEPVHQTFERRSRPDSFVSFVAGSWCRHRRRPRRRPRAAAAWEAIENVDHVRFTERIGHRGGREHEGGHEQGDGLREDRVGHPLGGGLEGRRKRRTKRGKLHDGRGGRLLSKDDVPAGRRGARSNGASPSRTSLTSSIQHSARELPGLP